MLVFLIGMPGCGKSFWGRRLADHFRCPFVDMDTEIEHLSQRSIAQLFEAGESHFRTVEQTVLRQTIQRSQANAFIATGGGTPCFDDNLAQMKRAGKVVYLQSAPEQLLTRVQNDPTVRPLLHEGSNVDLLRRLRDMLAARKHCYQQADLLVKDDALTLPIFVRHILPLLTP